MKNVTPDSPKYNTFGYMKFTQGGLYSCGGRNVEKPALQAYIDKEWVYINTDTIKTKTTLRDTTEWTLECKYINSLAVDPNDRSHLFVGGQYGLYELKNGKFNFFNHINSPIQRITLFYDDDTNKWSFFDYDIVQAGAPC